MLRCSARFYVPKLRSNEDNPLPGEGVGPSYHSDSKSRSRMARTRPLTESFRIIFINSARRYIDFTVLIMARKTN